MISAIALLFFLVIPGIGAVQVRRRWRSFREQIVALTAWPTVMYGSTEDSARGFLGRYRFLGALEAIQGKDTVWINDGTMSVSADLSKVSVFLLPSSSPDRSDVLEEENAVALADEAPYRLPWSKISTLPQGTRLIVSGAVYRERGHTVFRSNKQTPLTVILFDGEAQTLLRRSIWTGRHHNEYWNQITPISLLAGATLLFVFAYYLFRVPLLRLPALFALIGGAAPLIPFLPPGILLFFLYRSLWRIARVRRAERDLLMAPARFLSENNTRSEGEFTLPDGGRFVHRVVETLDSARRLAPLAKLRASSVARDGFETYHVFGSPSHEGRLGRSSDPLAENVIVAGDLIDTSRRSGRRAHIYEIASVVSFLAGFVVNWFLLFAALSTWIR